jgi:hypothetical protein
MTRLPGLTWRPAHPWSPHLHGILPTEDGPLLVAQVTRYDSPAGGEHWVGCVRLHAVTGRMATSDEACAAVEAWIAPQPITDFERALAAEPPMTAEEVAWVRAHRPGGRRRPAPRTMGER